MRTIAATALLLFVAVQSAAAASYDETTDARADIRSGLEQASKSSVPLLVIFGANWCGDCKVLDAALTTGASAPLIQKNFKVVKVNVGRFDQNVSIAESYGVPLKSGIPAIAVLSAEGKVVYATRAGELADARNMGDAAIYDFLSKISKAPK